MVVLLAALMLCAGAQGQEAADAPKGAVIRALADRLLACRVDDSGPIFISPIAEGRPGGLVPYFTHFAAFGLLRAYEATGDARYLDAADRWIDWYRAHQQDDGTVTDFKLSEDNSLTSTGDMDSTDSYAAMFLWVVAERQRVCGAPAEWLRERELSCFRALSAILLTMQPDGLTIAKPTYAIEYAMDNAEVVVGFRSAALIFEALGNKGMAAHARALAERTEAELRTLCSAEQGYFAWYRAPDGTTAYELEKWYPDVMAQVLVLMRIGGPSGADRALFELVAQKHLSAEYDAGKPWNHMWYGLAAQRVGNEEWTRKLIEPLATLPAEAIDGFDAIQCASALEALTGATAPRW